VRYHRWRNSQCRPRDVKLRFFKNYENLWEITIDIHCNTIHILYVYHPILGTSSSGKLHIPNEEVLQAGFTLSQLWSPWGRHRRIRKRQRRNEFDRDTQLYTEELIQVQSDLLYRQFRNFQNVSNALYISLYIIYIYIYIYILYIHNYTYIYMIYHVIYRYRKENAGKYWCTDASNMTCELWWLAGKVVQYKRGIINITKLLTANVVTPLQ
jgi:hypothetical protein